MKINIVGFLVLLGFVVYNNSKAGTLNPCEYMNLNASRMNQIDTGDDENFERIKQQNNKQMVIACQEYEIKALRQSHDDLNRDNY